MGVMLEAKSKLQIFYSGTEGQLNADNRNSKICSWFLSQSILAFLYLGFYVLEARLKFDSAIVSWGVNCILLNVLMGSIKSEFGDC